MARVCIIGAGSSGIASCQVLQARGIEFDCFEKGSGIGGNWRYGNDNGMSSAYRSLFINTSRAMMEYATYPMPDDYPDYPHHTQIARYFEGYVDHFGFRDRIRFNTEVARVEPAGDGWEVTLADGESHRYDAVMVANGHHWDPKYPEPPFPGQASFTGEQLHSHWYREPDERFVDRRVLVLGIGNSATDIATETSRVSATTYLAMRRGAYVMPKFIGGVPLDQLAPSWANRLPFAFTRPLLMREVKRVQGPMEGYGLPKPDHKLGEAHPTVSADLLDRIGHGRIAVKPNLERIDGPVVHFCDGTSAEVDTIVWCTGYRVEVPFLDAASVGPEPASLRLYKRVLHLDQRDLFFIGLMQSTGSAFPILERQSQLLAAHLTGTWAPPSRARMRADCEWRYRRALRRWGPHGRPTMRVDFDRYMHEHGVEIERGRRRAARNGA